MLVESALIPISDYQQILLPMDLDLRNPLQIKHTALLDSRVLVDFLFGKLKHLLQRLQDSVGLLGTTTKYSGIMGT